MPRGIPKNKKVEPKIEVKVVSVIIPKKELLVKLLCDNISRVFDREPGSYSRNAVEKLADEIIKLN